MWGIASLAKFCGGLGFRVLGLGGRAYGAMSRGARLAAVPREPCLGGARLCGRAMSREARLWGRV